MRNLFHVQALATATIEGRRLWRDTACRATRMSWNGILFGAMTGFLLSPSARGAGAGGENGGGRRGLGGFNLGPSDVAAAIACFTAGKSAGYDAELSIERLRESCGLRYDLLRAFVDLQLRAAAAGNRISPAAARGFVGSAR